MKEFASSTSNPPKLTRLEFPKSNGDGLHEWLFKCDQYYEFYDTSDESEVRIASLHLEDRACNGTKII